jgi:uncharacterized lipoprotein YehR (DUF1307 family)
MEKINDLFDQETTRVLDAFPSVYTKDDVVTLLSKLRTNALFAYDADKQATELSVDDFRAFLDNVKDGVEQMFNRGNVEYIDYESAEFSINYDNKISIENVDIEYDAVTEALTEIVEIQFQETFGNLIKK